MGTAGTLAAMFGARNPIFVYGNKSTRYTGSAVFGGTVQRHRLGPGRTRDRHKNLANQRYRYNGEPSYRYNGEPSYR